jgi:hypothetical protein
MGRQAEITDSGINRWTGGGPDRNPVPGRDENAPVHLQNQGNRQSGWTGAAGTENPVPGRDENAPVHLVIRKAEEKGSERRYTVYDILFFIH